MTDNGCCVDKSYTADTCMKLPDGKQCKDCWHVPRCVLLGYSGSDDTVCSFFPRRFSPKPEQESTELRHGS